jgi:hypothetical protein
MKVALFKQGLMMVKAEKPATVTNRKDKQWIFFAKLT